MRKSGHEVCVRIRAKDGEVITEDAIMSYLPLFGKEFPVQYKPFVEFFRTAVSKFNARDRTGWFTDTMTEKVAKQLFATGVKYELLIDGKVVE